MAGAGGTEERPSRQALSVSVAPVAEGGLQWGLVLPFHRGKAEGQAMR